MVVQLQKDWINGKDKILYSHPIDKKIAIELHNYLKEKGTVYISS